MSEEKHSLQVGCCSSKPAVTCNECGRLYWLDGTPVLNRQSKKVFMVKDEGFSQRDLHSSEKHNLLLDILAALAEPANPGTPEVHESYKRHLADLMERGHASDCEAVLKDAPVLCNCGIENGKEWLRDHPDDKIV
jgi:hypothetical protein